MNTVWMRRFKHDLTSYLWGLLALTCLGMPMGCSPQDSEPATTGTDRGVANAAIDADGLPPSLDAEVESDGTRTVDASVDAEAMTMADAEVPVRNRPNIVLIVADDLGWNDVGYHGSEIETPRIDRLVREGLAIDRFYVLPVCGPTRKGLLTGRSPITMGTLSNPNPSTDADALPLDEHLISETLQDAGYQTWIAGKWHLGGNAIFDYLPYHRGFDHFYGLVGPAIDHYSHTTTARSGAKDWQRNGETIDEMGYSTDLITNEAIRLIENRDPERPFFLYLAYNAVHTPLMAPDNLVEKYSFIDRSERQTYAAMVDALDTNIGRVMDAVSNAGIDENTLVVFHSDNGGDIMMGGADNDPLRGAKGQVYDGGIRVAGAMRWPGVIEPGRTTQQVFSVFDVFPTIASAVNIAPGNELPFDGHDHWARIQSDDIQLPSELVFTGNGVCIFHDEWKLVRSRRGRIELFRIADDISEANDLSAEHPDVVEDLTQRLDRVLANVMDQLN